MELGDVQCSIKEHLDWYLKLQWDFSKYVYIFLLHIFFNFKLILNSDRASNIMKIVEFYWDFVVQRLGYGLQNTFIWNTHNSCNYNMMTNVYMPKSLLSHYHSCKSASTPIFELWSVTYLMPQSQKSTHWSICLAWPCIIKHICHEIRNYWICCLHNVLWIRGKNYSAKLSICSICLMVNMDTVVCVLGFHTNNDTVTLTLTYASSSGRTQCGFIAGWFINYL